MTYGDNDDIEGEEDNNLQSYARKGMAQELAKKLGLLADVPGADTDTPDAGGMAPPMDQGQGQPGQPGDDKAAAGEDIPPELLEQVLSQLMKR